MSYQLEHALEEHKRKELSLVDACREYVQDKSVELDKRWEFFMTHAIGREHKPWIQRFASIDIDIIYDGFSRHQSIDMNDIIDQLTLKPNDAKDFGQLLVTPEQLLVFREEILESYVFSFDFDW